MNLESRPQSVLQWRSFFDNKKPGEVSATAGFPTDIEQEGREWLPIILLGIFLVVISSAAFYLLTGGGDRQGGQSSDSALSKDADASPQERIRWQAALEADTTYAYQYIPAGFSRNPFGRLRPGLSLDVLDEKAWQAAKATGSEFAIESYVEQFPGGLHETDARILLREFELAQGGSGAARPGKGPPG